MELYDQVLEAVQAIQTRTSLKPEVGVILGSGLGDLATEIAEPAIVPYADIPHFARSTVKGHAGRLIIGLLENVPVVAMQGRFHLYEGYHLQVLTLPVRVMRQLGAHTLIVTNAAGGVNPAYRPGDFMLIRDHINMPGLAGANPLLGPNDERFGGRFPPLAHAYDAQLRALAHSIAASSPEIMLHEGIYTMVGGPNYETGAELRFLRAVGTDAVGMSTVPEVIVARHAGMQVLGLSLITNTATGNETGEVDHAEVLAAADAVRPKFAALVRGIVREIPRLIATS
ncbi:MAG: purine-nucleoside phosphorylase [Chloroflexi bacterium]|nr:MAG: purine-nucleoside phosphorylase [Chloroflexota bacterium]TMC95708.1 MAG: purine-nucleoside phosphorylase [Chloroflexota bacterium]TMD69210.1 MAG: purine-nucleoside phosphorylase [Chloroflexota bacterium]